MEQIQIPRKTVDETWQLGEAVGRLLAPGDTVGLIGSLGTGKTSLSQGIGRGLSVPPCIPITSPTFTLLKIYPGCCPLYHFDFYRLERFDDLEAIGYWDYLQADGVCVIEWAEKFPQALPDDRLMIHIQIEGRGRRFVLESHGSVEILEHLRAADWARTSDSSPP